MQQMVGTDAIALAIALVGCSWAWSGAAHRKSPATIWLAVMTFAFATILLIRGIELVRFGFSS